MTVTVTSPNLRSTCPGGVEFGSTNVVRSGLVATAEYVNPFWSVKDPIGNCSAFSSVDVVVGAEDVEVAGEAMLVREISEAVVVVEASS